jgi:hypothetical protein
MKDTLFEHKNKKNILYIHVLLAHLPSPNLYVQDLETRLGVNATSRTTICIFQLSFCKKHLCKLIGNHNLQLQFLNYFLIKK